jgi:hypothetical protein
MKPSAKKRVLKAEAELATAELALRNNTRPLREYAHEHQVATIILGGFASGFALALLPLRWWAAVGALAGRTVALAARSTLAPALVGAAVTRIKRHDGATQHPSS